MTKYRRLYGLLWVIGLHLSVKSQINLAFQGGEPGDDWTYVSSGTDATAAAQVFLTGNIVSGTQSIVVGGNTPGGSCIDGGSGSGASVARFFTFNSIDISSSSQYTRTLFFHFGNRLPSCVGTGWDTGENLVFTAYHDGVAQTPITLVTGVNNLVVPIQNNAYTYQIPPCVESFYFHISINTNRRDELLFLDNVSLTSPFLNNGGGAGTNDTLSVCATDLPYTWGALLFNNFGTQSVTLQNQYGCDSVVNYTLTEQTQIVPSFASVGPYCVGANIPNLPNASINGITGSWSPAISNNITTTYTFTPNTGQCASATTLSIAITPQITPTFNPVGPYCSGATIPALPTSSTDPTPISGTWSPAINNTSTNNYTFTPNANACAIEAVLTIQILEPETPVFAPLGPYCAGTSIQALPSTSQNGITGSWSPAINNTQTTGYTFVPNLNFCATNAQLTIGIIAQETPVFNVPNDYCNGAVIAPLATTSINGISGTWSPVLNNTQTTAYTFTPNANECATTQTLEIDVFPVYFIESSVSICQTQAPYLWNGLNLTTTGTYQVNLTSSSGCDSTLVLNLLVETNVIVTINEQVCTSSLPYVFYNQTIDEAGIYTYTTNYQGLCDTTFILNLSLLNGPNIALNNTSIATCVSPVEVLYTIGNLQGISSCAWQTNGQTGNNCDGFLATYQSEGCYDLWIELTDLNGCINDTIIEDITCILPNPVAQFNTLETSYNVDQEISFVNFSSNASTYIWSFDNNSGSDTQVNPTYTFDDEGDMLVTLIAFNDANCSDTTSRVIRILNPLIFYVPNTFTPDGSQLNDIFQPIMTKGFDYWLYDLTIFNRWGQIVFQSLHPNKGWDGTYNGEPAPEGTYIWRISVQNAEDINEVYRGHVNLLR